MNGADQYIREQIDHHKTPGASYRFFSKDNILHKFITGFSNIAGQIKVNDETTFHAFSVTKTFTALAILQLLEQKHLDIEHPAKNYLPGFPYPGEITIRQLLTHSAGIPNPNPLSWIHLAGEHASFDRNRFFDTILEKHKKVKSKPNEIFSYSNLGYFLLGRIIESVSGLKYEEFVKNNIIDRLHISPMKLGFTITDFDQHAKGYINKYGLMNIVLGFFIEKKKYMANAEGIWKPFKNYYVNGTSYGGLIGTPDAFVRYIQELLRDESSFITNEYKKMLFTENFTMKNKATGMCMSWFCGTLNGQQYFAHAGGGGGYYCEIRQYPGIGRGSVIMFNRTGMKDEHFLNSIDQYFIKS